MVFNLFQKKKSATRADFYILMQMTITYNISCLPFWAENDGGYDVIFCSFLYLFFFHPEIVTLSFPAGQAGLSKGAYISLYEGYID